MLVRAVFVVALAAVVPYGFSRLWRTLAIGAAYKAKILCSIIFGAGRDVDPNRAPEVSADSYWPMRFCRAEVDRQAQSVTASFLGLRQRTAAFRPGLGATLSFADTVALPTVPAAADGGATAGAAPQSWGSARGTTELHRVVDAAFGEPNRRRLRRTRAILVVRDNLVVAERYAPGFSADTRFPGWSMTKSVLGALIGTLVGEGRLALDERQLLPAWQPPDPRADITLEDLLRMRSGLKFSEVYSDLRSDVVEMLFNRADTGAYAASLPLAATPGSAWSYASGTSNILSSIARRRVGDDAYVDWPRRALFDRLGMSSAILEPDAAGTFVASSFMLATARDWARFGQLFVEDGVGANERVLPGGWVQFSTNPTPQSDGPYAAHWWLKLQPEMGGGTPAAEQLPADTFFALGHEGQTLTVIPSLRLVVVRLGLSIYPDAWNHAAFLGNLLETL